MSCFFFFLIWTFTLLHFRKNDHNTSVSFDRHIHQTTTSTIIIDIYSIYLYLLYIFIIDICFARMSGQGVTISYKMNWRGDDRLVTGGGFR